MGYSVNDIREKIQNYPRVKLIHSPTSLYKLENLTEALGGPEIYIKRDDITELAFGGNKSRKLEFILKDVQNKKADSVVTWASLQSNWCLQTAAAARKIGLIPVLVLFETYDLPEFYDGNILLDFLVDAEIKTREAEKGEVVKEEKVQEVMEEVINEIKEWSHLPYVIPVGGSKPGWSMEKPYGAIGYVNAFLELADQVEEQDGGMDYIIHASGSGGTQAGLVVGAKALRKKTKIVGISVSDEKESFSKEILDIGRETVKSLGLDIPLERDDITVMDDYIGEGYGMVTKEVAEIISYVAQKEGFYLDPVYTGKAMIALVDLIKKGYFRKDDRVVFIHTGGTPALFPHKHQLTEYLIKSLA
ncbi:D-cysteine desulfhydrase family protein [bacterium]|nr:D-cysteine desulfhydrase family protein [bacterium]